jgi:hypothetical protein
MTDQTWTALAVDIAAVTSKVCMVVEVDLAVDTVMVDMSRAGMRAAGMEAVAMALVDMAERVLVVVTDTEAEVATMELETSSVTLVTLCT